VAKKVRSIFVGSSNHFQNLTPKYIGDNFASEIPNYFQIIPTIFYNFFPSIFLSLYIFALGTQFLLLFFLMSFHLQIGALIFPRHSIDFINCGRIGLEIRSCWRAVFSILQTKMKIESEFVKISEISVTAFQMECLSPSTSVNTKIMINLGFLSSFHYHILRRTIKRYLYQTRMLKYGFKRHRGHKVCVISKPLYVQIYKKDKNHLFGPRFNYTSFKIQIQGKMMMDQMEKSVRLPKLVYQWDHRIGNTG